MRREACMVPLAPSLTLTLLTGLLVTHSPVRSLYLPTRCSRAQLRTPKAAVRRSLPTSTLGVVVPSIWGGGPLRRWERAVPGAE